MKRWQICIVAGALAAGCVNEGDDGEPTADPTRAPVTATTQLTDDSTTFVAAATVDLAGDIDPAETFTYFPGYLEIDRLALGESLDFGDANLFPFLGTTAELAACTTGSGADPADQTCDARLPESAFPACTSPAQTTACSCTGDALLDTGTCIEVTYLDWNTLLTGGSGTVADPARLASHRLLDPVKDDPSSFKNGSCVTTTKVLGKMDLTAAAVANNSEYSYLALKRHANNGDAGYSWIFTSIPPELDPTFYNCSDGEPLVYTLTQGDVMIVGNFNPSSGADLIVRRVTAAADGIQLLAQDVVVLDAMTAGNPVWEPIPGVQNIAAVNSTITRAGVFEEIAGVDQAGNRTDRGAVSGVPGAYNYGPKIFAEAAVDFTVFTQGGNRCEAKFFGSVITQPSRSKTSDLKDLLGPQLFNFGALSVEASLTESCDKEIVYAVDSLSGPGVETDDPDSIDGVVCEWTFTHTDGTTKTANDCQGTLALGANDPSGTWSAELEVTIGAGISCSNTQTVGSVEVFSPLSVGVTTSPGCGLDFAYSGTVDGGSADTTKSWTFDPAVAEQTPIDDLSGTAVGAAGGTYKVTLTAEDVRAGNTCTASADSYVTVDDELSITPTLTPSCDLDFGYDALIDGGLNTPTIQWVFAPEPGTTGTATASDATAAAGTVTVTGDGGTFRGTVTVSETRDGQNCQASGSAIVDAYPALTASLALTETCSLDFGYSGSSTGGSGSLTYDWDFGPSGATDEPSGELAGNVSVDAEGTFTAMLTVTDDRADASCSETANGSVGVFDPLQVTNVQLSPTCGLDFAYSGAVSGGSDSANVEWAFDAGVTATPTNALSGNATAAAPATGISGKLTITDVRDGVTCTADGSDTVDAFAPLSVNVAVTDSCDLAFDYAASSLLGGSGDVSYAWTVTPQGTGTASLDAPSGASGAGSVTVGNEDYQLALTVTDNRTDIECSAGANGTAHPFAPITLNITPSSESNSCTDGLATDALTYAATIAGGDGNYTYTWTGCTSSAGASCTVDPDDSTFCADQDVFVTVGDSSICDPADSETETYSKVTLVSSTDN